MELFHTSPEEVVKINRTGRFGEFLCFSAHEYVMTAGDHITYRISIDENDIIEASQLFYHEDAAKLDPIVAQVMSLADCDEDTAISYIEQKDDCGDAEISWDIQSLTAKAAKTLGFRGVSMRDEQGTVYMIDMLGRESDLELI